MIFVKLISGLGNQLFQYVLARQLSIQNSTSLKLDTSFYDTQNIRSYKLDNYNINAAVATEKELDDLIGVYNRSTIFAKFYKKMQSCLPKHYRRFYSEGEWWVYEPEVLKVFGKVYLDGYWQHYKYFEKVDPLIFDELTLKGDFSEDALRFIYEIENTPVSVSLHIRRGDYITDAQANNLMGVLPIDYYLKAIEIIKDQCENITVFVFSDDLNWAESNLKLDVPTKFVDIDGGAKEDVELDLMRRCNHNIIANSSFSWWGGFLNRNSNKIVIAPKQWVRPLDVNEKINIQLPRWIKV
jgi:hypothetical protein